MDLYALVFLLLHSSFFAIADKLTLCVGAVNSLGNSNEYIPNSFSSIGRTIDFVGPGDSSVIRTLTIPQFANANTSNILTEYSSWSATSAATPHVAGIGALLMSRLNAPTPSISNLAMEDIEQIIERSANPIIQPGTTTLNSDFGAGNIDAGKAMASILSPSFEIIHINSPQTISFPSTPFITDTTISIEENDYLLFFEDNGDAFNLRQDDYLVDIYKITGDFTFTIPSNSQIVDAWPIHSTSTGAFIDSINGNEGAWIVNLDSFDNGSANMSALFYHFKERSNGNSVNEWYPFNFQSNNSRVKFELSLYTQLGTAISKKFFSENSLKIIPNPSSSNAVLTVNIEEVKPFKIEIFDFHGRLVDKQILRNVSLGENQFNLKATGLSRGIYYVSFSSSNSRNSLKWIIK